MTLSKRLNTIASLVPHGARVCDVGTDHARLPIFLISEGIAKAVVATDIRKKPLENADKNILESGIKGIETRLCDGLSAVSPDEANVIIIAGIGGEVISGIISRTAWLKNNPAPLLILQPTTSPEFLRRFLSKSGFNIESEIAVSDNDKLYSVMSVRFKNQNITYNEIYNYIGKITAKSVDGRLYIEKQYKRLKKTADALEDIKARQEKYIYYKKLSDELSELL